MSKSGKNGGGSKLRAAWGKIVHNPTFTLKEQFGYSSGIMGNSMAQDVEAYALTLFLTRFMGIAASYVLILELVAKIANIIVDPVAGMILDRRGKHGRSRAKAFALVMPLPLAVSSILLFVVPGIGLSARIAYVFVFYLIYCVADGFYDMALSTISARMTTNPKDRKNFYTVAQFASTLGGMLPSGLIPVFVALYMDKEALIYLLFAIFFGVVGFALMIVPYFTLTEKTAAPWRKEAPVALNFKALMLNRPMWCLIFSQIVDSVRQVCYSGLAYFYLETLGSFWMASVAGTISAALSYLGIAAVPFIGSKLSSRDIIMYGYFYTGILYVVFLLVGYKSLLVVALIVGFAGLPNGAMSSSRNILLADSTDYMEYMTWKKYGEPVRSEAMVFALRSTAARISGFWKSLLFPAGLVLIGYVSAKSFGSTTISVVQSTETLNGIFYLITVSGIVGNIVPGIIMSFDHYTGKRKEKILAELYEMRAQRQAEWDAEHPAAPQSAAAQPVKGGSES
ncbi:MAG: MFS transporter [Clostridia bacterium]|nr:MFS transporter [Clostridia bacterium]